jgi:D-serine deaminase-like pyridoxal phosphate-dependent protein
MHTLFDIQTPAALVDAGKLQGNIQRMQARMNSLGVRFRPHVKTSKCLDVVRAQLAAGARGITVSTLKEADEFFAAGIADILYAVEIAPAKLPHALELRRRGCRLKLLVDNLDSARAIARFGQDSGERFEVFVEIDTDGHRAGVKPDDAALIEIARALQGPGAVLAGVLAHAGSSYDASTPAQLQAIAENERARAVAAANALRGAGLQCPIVSVGSTPTALAAETLSGVTEVRAGVYVFFDLVMANTGVCGIGDVALSVLTTVIGHRADKGWVLVDAGWMAMSRDRGTQRQPIDYGYGLVCDAEGNPVPGYTMTATNQEHGIVSSPARAEDDVVRRFPVGMQLRILPNHACATGAQFDEYNVVEGTRHIATWSRFHGW